MKIEKLLVYAKDWNTNGRFTRVAQNVLNLVFSSFSNTKLTSSKSFKEILEATIPYTERHFARINQIMTNSFIVDFTLESMDMLGSIGGDEPYGRDSEPEYVPVAAPKAKKEEEESEEAARPAVDVTAETEEEQEEEEERGEEQEEERQVKKGSKKGKDAEKSKKVKKTEKDSGNKRKPHAEETARAAKKHKKAGPQSK